MGKVGCRSKLLRLRRRLLPAAIVTIKYKTIIVTVIILFATALILLFMGRLPICKCGYISFWAPNVNSPENSQMISDWYTFSHLIHGFIFFWLLGKFAKKLSLSKRFFLALLIEIGWELLENSPMIIDRYRATTISYDYYGDSILNSICDVVAMIIGYWLAQKFPVWISILLVVVMELVVGYVIRDNLTLNIIMLLYPIEVIKNWQTGI